MTAVLEVRSLTKRFPVQRTLPWAATKQVHAVEDVSFRVARGETLSLVGESGCGKSTVGRLVLRLIRPTMGEVHVNGVRIDDMSERSLRRVRPTIQVVFQDPFSSLSPRMRIRDILAEPLRNFQIAKTETEIGEAAATLLDMVRLPTGSLDRFPHEFSGGQRQRICIARALASKPDIIVCDEAVSALDVSVKAQVVNLLADLQAEFGISLLFISHDLAVVEHLTHHVAVMYLGSLVEVAPRDILFSRPLHPYTQALLSAIPSLTPGVPSGRIVLHGEVPSPIDPPSGCKFRTRCPYAFERCAVEVPSLAPQRSSAHLVACHLVVASTSPSAQHSAARIESA